ncbi:MAG: ABC transporter transmembrane domain-containing protein [Pseudomonadota bacterium]
MIEFYAAIFRATGRAQIVLIVLSLIVAGLSPIPLEYQRDIVNGLTQGLDEAALLGLGFEMGAVILFSLVLKWVLGYRSGVVGEGVIRRLRSLIVDRSVSGEMVDRNRGTTASLIASESEALGKFVGSSVAEPLLQFGTLVSVLGYVAVTQPRLGLVIALIVLPQAIIVMATQARINALVQERVLLLRRAVNGVTASEVAAQMDAIREDVDGIYEARRQMFVWKLSTKMILSALNGAGLVLVLVLGGTLVIDGLSDLGTVVAATVALGRIQGPWRQLVAFYRNMSAVRVQYELLRDVIGLLGARHATQ